MVDTTALRPGATAAGEVQLTNRSAPATFTLAFEGVAPGLLVDVLGLKVQEVGGQARVLYDGPLKAGTPLALGRFSANAGVRLRLTFAWPAGGRTSAPGTNGAGRAPLERNDMSGAEQPRQPSRAGGWVVNVLLAAAVLLCALIVIPAVLGFHRYVIDGGSMEPAIPYGSMAYAREVPVEELVVGDVITFQPPPEFPVEQPVTHRIVEIEETPSGRTFRTQGDANAAPDPWTMTLDSPTQPRVEFHLAYVGYIYIALSIWWVRFLLITVPAVAVAVWIVVVLWREAGREVDHEKARLAAGGTSGR